jgi:fermentation-respiration switch protein FrsA (DUF1100 family)/ketosteroid isomerase-like protein
MRRLLLFAYSLLTAAAVADSAADAAAIRAKIVKGAEAAMRGDAAGIMSHYAKDILLSYPGIPDQEYDTLLKGYAEPRPAGMTMRTEPEFDELLISGDLAVVLVNWTTTLAFTDPPRQTTRQARDIQVWREREGEWLFVRGMHFRNATGVPTAGADVTTIVPKSGRTTQQDAAAIREAIGRSRVTAKDALVIRRGVADETVEQYPVTEVLVSGGLAVVRLGVPGQTVELQVWTHEKPAGWRLARTMQLDHVEELTVRDAAGVDRKATFVMPPTGPVRGGVLFLHWLGPPPRSDRGEFRQHAEELARHGIASLAVDQPWAQPQWFRMRDPEHDLAFSETHLQSVGLALDELARRLPPSTCIALAGHDFGAMYGAMVAARDPRIRAAVVMAAVPRFSDWFLLGRDKLDEETKKRLAASVEKFNTATALAARADLPVLFQFARNDRFVSEEQAGDLIAAVRAAKEVRWYETEHRLATPAVRKDAVEWLLRWFKGASCGAR